MLLRKNLPIFVAPGLLVATVLSGCIIVGGGSGSSSHQSGGVGGGVGGYYDDTSAGVGGEYEVTTDAATSSTSSGNTTTCAGIDTGSRVTDCDKMNISPAQGASKICGEKQDQWPLGYDACKHGFSIFINDSASTLLYCLEKIGVQDACDDKLVQACIDQTYKNVCQDPEIGADCKDLNTNLCGAYAKAGVVDEAQCTKELMPLNDTGRTDLTNCMITALDAGNVTCQAAYDSCYDQLLTFQQ